MMTDRVQKEEDGHQITHEVLQRAIAIDRNCNFEDVKVQEISKSHGSNKGENFTCVLFALDIKAIVNVSEARTTQQQQHTECWGDFNSKQFARQKFLQNPFLGCQWSHLKAKQNFWPVESAT